MFNFLKENTQEVKITKTRKAAVLPNIAVQAQNRVKFSPEALELIGHVVNNHIYVAKMGSNVVIASLDAIKAIDANMGQALNSGEGVTHYSNSGVATLLGGNKSEWKIVTDAPVHQDDDCTLWAITETVNGAEKLAEIESKKEEKWTAEPGTEDENIGEEASLEDFKDLEEVEDEATSSDVYNSEESFA